MLTQRTNVAPQKRVAKKFKPMFDVAWLEDMDQLLTSNPKYQLAIISKNRKRAVKAAVRKLNTIARRRHYVPVMRKRAIKKFGKPPSEQKIPAKSYAAVDENLKNLKRHFDNAKNVYRLLLTQDLFLYASYDFRVFEQKPKKGKRKVIGTELFNSIDTMLEFKKFFNGRKKRYLNFDNGDHPYSYYYRVENVFTFLYGKPAKTLPGNKKPPVKVFTEAVFDEMEIEFSASQYSDFRKDPVLGQS